MKTEDIWNRPILAYDKLLKLKTIKVTFRRKSEYGERGWVAETEAGNNISPLGIYKTKAQMLDMLTSRYLAEVFDDCAFITPRYVLKNPRWAHNRFGGMFEVALSMRSEL
jgi:hypothetical protein